MKYSKKQLGLKKSDETLALVGNPNVGKSVVFSTLTGKYRDVSNYPGTTVEISHGKGKFRGKERTIIDTPGTDSLAPLSEDQKVARDIISGINPEKIIQVADSKNLKRAINLFLQLKEFETPMILDLNMIDEAESRKIEIETEALSKKLGIPVVKTAATERRGISNLKKTIENAKKPQIDVEYPEKIEKALNEFKEIFKNRGIGLLYLLEPNEMDSYIKNNFGEEKAQKTYEIYLKAQENYSRDLAYIINQKIRKKSSELFDQYVNQQKLKNTPLREKISNLTMNPITGIPIFLGVLYLVYWFVGYLGAQVLVDFLEVDIFGKIINPYIRDLVIHSIGKGAISEILVGDFGVFTIGITWSIALILPIITTFFLAFSILEDCGYIPRLTAVADKLFRKIGLNGKAVLPMVLGFGCDTMATVTTRTLDTKKERIIATLMLALGIPCSAQLGVIFAIMALLPPYFMYLWIVLIASQLLLVAWLASKILPGEKGDFIMELPPLRIPKLENIIKKTYYRVKWFLSEVVPIFLLGTFLIGVAEVTGVLLKVRQLLRPIVSGWMGLPPETTKIFILGFIRRDFAAAGILDLAQTQLLPIQTFIATVAITLFVPCVANFIIIIKERGVKTALAIVGFIIPFAFFIAGLINQISRILGVL
ncbi:ferrous iron transport protein B [archaeon SCG-AAA382B04]|nr:ferrous iron transport protein B [archaeon SCG-AAA382B04]